MKSKQKDNPVGLKKLHALDEAFLQKQENILNDLFVAIKSGEKSKTLKTLVKKFEKGRNKLSLLLREIKKVEKAELAAEKKKQKAALKEAEKKKKKAEAEKKKKAAKAAKSKKSTKTVKKEVAKPDVEKKEAAKPKVFKVSRVEKATPTAKAPGKSSELNAKLAIAGMQEISTVEALEKYLVGETRATVLRRGNSRKNALLAS
ncbi:MAG: hypothetical protein AAFQ94_26860 [Bacteroidota bacterium]